MKPETPHPDDGRLSQLLHEWKVGSPLPPRFNERVWHRLERKEVPAVDPLLLLRIWIAQAFARPRFAFSYAAALLLAGLLAGFWQAQVTSRRASEALSARYVQMVDPYQTPHH